MQAVSSVPRPKPRAAGPDRSCWGESSRTVTAMNVMAVRPLGHWVRIQNRTAAPIETKTRMALTRAGSASATTTLGLRAGSRAAAGSCRSASPLAAAERPSATRTVASARRRCDTVSVSSSARRRTVARSRRSAASSEPPAVAECHPAGSRSATRPASSPAMPGGRPRRWLSMRRQPDKAANKPAMPAPRMALR